MEDRERARELAEEYVANDRSTEWFERLYAEGANEEADIPWADFEPNPNLVAYLDRTTLSPAGQRALKVGCGLGDDVEELSDRGFDVTAFDFVLESYTLQVLPGQKRRQAIRHIADFVAPGGTLLVICRGRDADESKGELPWPLEKETLSNFEDAGLELVTFEDYEDDETPPVRRFRAEFERPS